MKTKLKHLLYRIFKARGSGLLKDEEDPRDLHISDLGWSLFGYTPKHKEKIIETKSLKNQKTLNTCVFNSATVQKEIDENVVLSVRSLVAYAQKVGLLTGNGWSTLRNGQKVLKDYGALEEKDCPDMYHDNWNIYSNINLQKEKAAKHKTKSYWRVSNKEEVLKLIDEGRILHCAMEWYTGFNQGGGFSFPWIIYKIVGWLVGGHAVALKGYKFGYKNQDVFVFQNSYGLWGDGGDFYIEMDYFVKNSLNKYGAYANLDIEIDVARWLVNHNWKIVKGDNSPDVYLIEDGKKKKFKDLATLYSWNYLDSDIINVDSQYLDKVEAGEELNFWDGQNVKAIKAIIQQKGELKNIFENYFNELF